VYVRGRTKVLLGRGRQPLLSDGRQRGTPAHPPCVAPRLLSVQYGAQGNSQTESHEPQHARRYGGPSSAGWPAPGQYEGQSAHQQPR
jgi:hypothetical protein